MAEIRRLSIAAALVDYPVSQGEFRELIGLPAGMRYSFGELLPNVDYRLMPLRRENDGSYYALAVVVSYEKAATPGETKDILSMSVVFQPAHGPRFVTDPDEWPRSDILRLKDLWKKSGLSLKEFTSREKLPEFIELAARARNQEAHERAKAKKRQSEATIPP